MEVIRDNVPSGVTNRSTAGSQVVLLKEEEEEEEEEEEKEEYDVKKVKLRNEREGYGEGGRRKKEED